MYSHLDREDMASVEIENESGTFTLVNTADGYFRAEGHENVALDEAKVASLVATCGAPLSKTRVTADASDESR